MPTCPRCGSIHVIKNGHMHTWKPKFACKDCQRQFVENPARKPISAKTKALMDKLLLERVSLAGIGRITGVSAQWLPDYVNAKNAARPQVTDIPAQKNAS